MVPTYRTLVVAWLFASWPATRAVGNGSTTMVTVQSSISRVSQSLAVTTRVSTRCWVSHRFAITAKLRKKAQI